MARHFANDARDPDRAVVLIDPKGPLAELCLGLVPAERTVHYLDLGHPEIGINPLTIDASPGRPRRRLPAGADRGQPARRDPGRLGLVPAPGRRRRLRGRARRRRSGTSTACSTSATSPYRDERRPRASTQIAGSDFARHYWRREFPALLADRGFAAQALNPPRNKLERLISTREIDTLLRHPVTLDLEGILERGEVLIVAGAKADRRRGQHRPRHPAAAAAPAPRDPGPARPARRPTAGACRCSSTRPTTSSPRRSPRCSPKAAPPGSRPSSPGSTPRRSATRSSAPACARCCSRSRSSACARWKTPARSPAWRWRSTPTASPSTKTSKNDCASHPTTSSGSPSTERSTSGSPTASRAPASSPTPSRWSSSTTQALAAHHTRSAARARRRTTPSHLPDPLAATSATTRHAGATPQRSAVAAPSRRPSDGRRDAVRQRRRRLQLPLDATDGARSRGLERLIAARELPRRAPLRRRRHRARPPRRDSCRAPCSRATSRSSATSGATSSSPRRSCASCGGPTRVRPGRPTAACASSSDAGYLERFRPLARRGSYPWTYHLGARRPPPPPARRHHRTAASATARARSTTTATSCTSSSSTPGCSPTAAPLGDALLAWDGETDIEPPPRGSRTASCASTTTGQPKASATRAPGSLRPDAVLEIAGDDGEPARRLFLVEYDRTRRVDKNYDKFRRYDAFLCWWWRHTPYADRDDAAVRALRLPRPRPARAVPRRRRPRAHRPPLAPQRPTRAPRVRRPPTHPLRARARRP